MSPVRLLRTLRRPRSQRGAAAVEFALVLPLLLAVFCAVVDFGLWFNNAQNARQGVREGARQGVVGRWAEPGCSGTQMEQLACKTDKSIGAVNGTTYTKVVLPPTGWKQGEQLLVCSYVKSSSVTGFTPLPDGGSVKSATRMSIEVVPTAPGDIPTSGVQEGPATLNWSWCA